MEIILYDLPKLSLNKWYAGAHWTERKRIKDNYSLIIRNQFNVTLSKEKKYHVSYSFLFKGSPLDASNCGAMVKLIEDIIFEDDNYKIIKSITIQSGKSKKKDSCFIEVIEI